SRFFRGLAPRRLLDRFVVLDQTARECPAPVARTVVQPDEEHAAVALDDGVRADLNKQELGEAADRAGGPITPVDSREHERRAVSWTKCERRNGGGVAQFPLARRSFR